MVKQEDKCYVGDAVDNLTAEQVRGAMTTIAQANVFEKDGVKNTRKRKKMQEGAKSDCNRVNS